MTASVTELPSVAPLRGATIVPIALARRGAALRDTAPIRSRRPTLFVHLLEPALGRAASEEGRAPRLQSLALARLRRSSDDDRRRVVLLRFVAMLMNGSNANASDSTFASDSTPPPLLPGLNGQRDERRGVHLSPPLPFFAESHVTPRDTRGHLSPSSPPVSTHGNARSDGRSSAGDHGRLRHDIRRRARAPAACPGPYRLAPTIRCRSHTTPPTRTASARRAGPGPGATPAAGGRKES